MNACPRSYGVSVGAFYSDIEHQTEDKFEDSLIKMAIAKEQLMWFIKKGDLILSNEPKEVKRWFTINFPETGSRKGIVPIYTYDDEDIPGRFSNSQDGKLNSYLGYLLPNSNKCLRINYPQYAQV